MRRLRTAVKSSPRLLQLEKAHEQQRRPNSAKINKQTNKQMGPRDFPLVVQWLRLRAPNAGGPGLIPGQGIRSRIMQLRACMTQLKIPRAATKTHCSQINKYFKNKQKNKCGHYTFVKTHRTEWTTPRVNPNVNYGHWVIMTLSM